MEDLGYTKSRVATYKYVKSGISLEQFNIRTEQSLVNTGDNKPFTFMSLDAKYFNGRNRARSSME